MNSTRDLAPLLQRTAQALLQHRELDPFFRALMEVLRDTWDIDAAGVGRYHPEDNSFEFILMDVAIEGFRRSVGTRFKAERPTPSEWLMRNQPVLLIPDTDEISARHGIDFEPYRPLRSGIGFLLEHGDRLIGNMFIGSKRLNAFDEGDLELVEAVRPIMALALENAIAFQELDGLRCRAEREGEFLRQEIGEHFPLDGMVGSSRTWRNVLQQVRAVAPTDSTLLIMGETGTGKELVARAAHERSRRAAGPFIKVNCGALPESLIESELFGHERGSFTGATARRLGRFEVAHGGTLFLDEIGELPLASQVKLLRALENREIERVGSTRPFPVDVRIIAATNRDLQREVEAGRFRADLFYRLNVCPIVLPPLREREEDISMLAHYFVDLFAQRHGRGRMTLAPGCLPALAGYPWPGNVRELEHLVERAVILTPGGTVDLRPFLEPYTPHPIAAAAAPATSLETLGRIGAAPLASGVSVPMRDAFAEAERDLILAALQAAQGRIGGPQGAAARLGLKRQTLQSKLKKHGIDPGTFRGGGAGE
jgi:formate hydrogenlyase transcriptional activator